MLASLNWSKRRTRIDIINTAEMLEEEKVAGAAAVAFVSQRRAFFAVTMPAAHVAIRNQMSCSSPDADLPVCLERPAGALITFGSAVRDASQTFRRGDGTTSIAAMSSSLA